MRISVFNKVKSSVKNPYLCKKNLNRITLHNIRAYAFHGCLPEERKIGSEYRVDLSVKANLKKSVETDQLNDTVDYVHLNRIVKEEMAVPSNLLEHVANRILTRVMDELPLVKKATVKVSKINPPLGGDVERVEVELTKRR